MVVMIMSGWKIYDASPFFPITFPAWMTLGNWLGAAIAWHFAAMWLFGVNGLCYLAYGLISGHLRQRLLPLSVSAVWRDLKLALTFRLHHRPDQYNAVQRLLYVVVVLAGILAVLSGLSIWKPVQLQNTDCPVRRLRGRPAGLAFPGHERDRRVRVGTCRHGGAGAQHIPADDYRLDPPQTERPIMKGRPKLGDHRRELVRPNAGSSSNPACRWGR